MQVRRVYSEEGTVSWALKNEEITRTKRKGVSFSSRREEALETGSATSVHMLHILERERGMIWENGIKTCIISYKK